MSLPRNATGMTREKQSFSSGRLLSKCVVWDGPPWNIKLQLGLAGMGAEGWEEDTSNNKQIQSLNHVNIPAVNTQKRHSVLGKVGFTWGTHNFSYFSSKDIDGGHSSKLF